MESVERPKSRFIHNLNERNISFFTELNVGPYDALERDMGKLGAQRVKGKQVTTINDRLSGIMRDRTEKLAEQLLSSKKDEEDMKSRIRTNIIERRRTLPLDFIFRRALKRYVKAHLEDGIKRWKSFVKTRTSSRATTQKSDTICSHHSTAYTRIPWEENVLQLCEKYDGLN